MANTMVEMKWQNSHDDVVKWRLLARTMTTAAIGIKVSAFIRLSRSAGL
jgi:hypothetical protein